MASEDEGKGKSKSGQLVPAGEQKPERDWSKGRDSKGRFVAGEWPGGPGRPKALDSHETLRAIGNTATPERIARATDAVLRRAEKGDVQAYREVLNRLLGLAPQSIGVYGQQSSIGLEIVTSLQQLAASQGEDEG